MPETLDPAQAKAVRKKASGSSFYIAMRLMPKEERAALVGSEPGRFRLPGESDLRFNWVEAWTAALDEPEMRELVMDAWRMVVPKKVAAARLGS